MSHAHIHAHTLTPDHSLNLTFTLRTHSLTHSLARSLAQSPKYKYMPNIDVQLGTTRVRKLIKNKICFRLDPKWEHSISITKFVGEKFDWQVLCSNLLGIHLNSSDQCIILLTSAAFNKVTFARSTLFFFLLKSFGFNKSSNRSQQCSTIWCQREQQQEEKNTDPLLYNRNHYYMYLSKRNFMYSNANHSTFLHSKSRSVLHLVDVIL